MLRIGAYEIEGVLGRGGSASVYRARRPSGEVVALKLMTRRLGPDVLARFERERRLHATLGAKEGFVPLLDAGEHEGQPYLVMPLVPGGTLRARLERGTFTVEATRDLGIALALALGRAHTLGIVHRDVKPENVLFDADGSPLVADLGLAKHFAAAPGASQSAAISVAGELRGTVLYMPREQLAGEPLDGSADVYALAATLYECLAGRPPHTGTTLVEVMTSASSARVVSLARARPEVPAALAAAIERGLALEPARRFPEGTAFARALEARVARRSRAPLVAVGLGAIALGAFALARGSVPPVSPAPRVSPLPSAAPTATPVAGTIAAIISEARRLHRAGDRAGALAGIERALALDPRNASALVSRGVLHDEAGERSSAMALYSRALESDPKSVMALACRAEARARVHDQEGALADAERALGLDPKSARALRSRALVRMLRGDVRALDDLTYALELEPDDAATHAFLGDALRGLPGSRGIDLERSEAELTRSLELSARSSSVWSVRAKVRFDRGNHAGALADLDRAAELGPLEVRESLLRAEIQERVGDLAGAFATLDQAIVAWPGVPALRVARGTNRRARGDAAGALRDYTRALELEPDNALALVNRGMLLAARGDLAGARADLDRAIELCPRDPTCLRARAASRRQLKDDKGALEDIERALACDPNDPLSYVARAEILEASGDVQGATNDLDRALDLSPSPALAATIRAALGRVAKPGK